MYSRLETVKSFFPSLYNSSKEKLGTMVTSMTMSEADYLYKTENTDKDIVDLLTSKLEMEVILGLKFIIAYILSGRDITVFMPRVFEIFLMTKENFFMRKLCLAIIDNLSLKKRDELLLLLNVITKFSHDPDPLNRWILLQLTGSLRGQAIANDCFKILVPFTMDSNPVLRRVALVAIVQYIQKKMSLDFSIEEFTKILKKYMSDPHPLVFSTVFYAITETRNTDYLSFALQNRFKYICANVNKIDDFYYERAVFTLVNFSKVILFNNFDKNAEYIQTLFNAIYSCAKHCTNNSKVLTAMNALYEIINDINKIRLNVILKEELHIFKSNKQLEKIAKMIIRMYLQSGNDYEKYMSLELVNKFMKNGNEYCMVIKSHIEKFHNLFYLKCIDKDKEFLASKKLEILIEISNDKNVKMILDELKRNLTYPSGNIKKKIIQTIYYICTRHSHIDGNQNIVAICIEKLIELLKLKEENVISQIIICLRKLILEIKEQTKFVLIYSIKNFKKNITSNVARANIVWMIGQYIETIPTVAVDFYRRLLLDLENESYDVKSQILGLTVRIWAKLELLAVKYENQGDKDEIIRRVEMMIGYAVEKLLYDSNYNIREKARMIDFCIRNSVFKDKYDFINNLTSSTIPKVKPLDDVTKDKVFPLSVITLLNQSEEDLSYQQKFSYEMIDHTYDPNLYKVSFDELIHVENEIEMTSASNSQKENDTAGRYVSLKQEMNVNQVVSNFNSGIDIEEKKKALKNQLDDFLKNDDEEEEYDVEIKKG